MEKLLSSLGPGPEPSGFDFSPRILLFFLSLAKKGSFPKIGLLRARDFSSTNDAMSSIQTSLLSALRIRSAWSRQLLCSLGGSLVIIFLMFSGPSILFKYPIAFSVLAQLDRRIKFRSPSCLLPFSCSCEPLKSL